jgi:hypothetical protein
MELKNRIKTTSKLVIEVTSDPDDVLLQTPGVTLWVHTQQDRCIAALTVTPDEAQRIAALLVAQAMAVVE